MRARLAALDKAGYGLAVIDSPPASLTRSVSVVALADLVMIPARPSPHDLRAIGSTGAWCSGRGPPFVFA
jgi:chromosome partitioning protein